MKKRKTNSRHEEYVQRVNASRKVLGCESHYYGQDMTDWLDSLGLNEGRGLRHTEETIKGRCV
jgi:hypothetical protein